VKRTVGRTPGKETFSPTAQRKDGEDCHFNLRANEPHCGGSPLGRDTKHGEGGKKRDFLSSPGKWPVALHPIKVPLRPCTRNRQGKPQGKGGNRFRLKLPSISEERNTRANLGLEKLL